MTASLRQAVAPAVPDDARPHIERSVAAELRHQHPGIRDIDFTWHTVTEGDEMFPAMIGWHFITATGLVDDDDS